MSGKKKYRVNDRRKKVRVCHPRHALIARSSQSAGEITNSTLRWSEAQTG